jgi:hypothetical protein
MASRMQDLTPGTRGDMLFYGDLDTAVTILDEPFAHFWILEVCTRVSDRRRSAAR